MKILFAKSKWEMWDAPLAHFLQRTVEGGYDAAEIYLPAVAESPSELAVQVRDVGLGLIAQINTLGVTPEAHIDSLHRHFDLAAATEPLLINSHTGSDLFPLEENLRIYREAGRLSKESGILLLHETHRGRPTFSGPTTCALLDALPELGLTADFSHWFCVHESDLSDQPENVAAAVARARHIHARVGFEEGPQVANPLASATLPTTEKFLALWRRIIAAREGAEADFLTITPESGPVPYMPLDSAGRPVADAWETNGRFLAFLKDRLVGFSPGERT